MPRSKGVSGSGTTQLMGVWTSIATPRRGPYRELEHEELVGARPGIGTFVIKMLSDDSLAAHGPLRQDLERWFAKARLAGLDDDSIEAREKGTGAAGAPAESVAHGALQRELAPIRSKQRVVASCTATSTPLTSPALDLEPQKRELECQRPDPMAG